MKGHELINRLADDEMPDTESVRAACHRQAAIKHTAPANRIRRSTIAIVIAACLVFSTAIVATGYYLSSFDRLREVIGDEHADTLTPVETMFTAAFSGFSDSGFRGELVAAGGVSGNVIDVF